MRAASLAAELREALGIDAKVTPGGRGQFDVLVEGRRVWSKHELGRFPEDGEIPVLLSTPQ
jgi:predicted Rdx family selenoprotein